jgi:D-3-phosphoglycerate dehydrogenase
VFNAPFSNTRSVAELVLGEIIMLSRQVFARSAACHRGLWHKSADGSHEVRGKTLGIVGYGHIGSQLSVLAEALGMQVRYFDILAKLPLGNAQPCAACTSCWHRGGLREPARAGHRADARDDRAGRAGGDAPRAA